LLTALGLALAASAVAGVIVIASDQRQDPARCPPPLQAGPTRCCAPGQAEIDGRCEGKALECPSHMSLVAGSCVAASGRVVLGPGRLRVGPSDWEAQGRVEARDVAVPAFELDVTEVEHHRFRACSAAGKCPALAASEPGRPVTGLHPEQAAAFCRFVGGRLPTSDEWLFAAAGSAGRRFPWGQTGLVCRRSSFGLVAGPCGEGRGGPEITAARPSGRSPEGLYDLSGNVAEWTSEPGGGFVARGGSYASQLAADLKSWAAKPFAGASPEVGFRCAYSLAR